MAKSADAFRTISEVADWLETPTHVLRFWESKFTQVKPVKRAGGRRYYRPADMELLGGIKRLLHDEGMTIKGVQKLLRDRGVAHVSALSQPLDDAADFIEAEVEPIESTVIPFRQGDPAPPSAGPQPEPVAVPEPDAETAEEPEDAVAPVMPEEAAMDDAAPDTAETPELDVEPTGAVDDDTPAPQEAPVDTDTPEPAIAEDPAPEQPSEPEATAAEVSDLPSESDVAAAEDSASDLPEPDLPPEPEVAETEADASETAQDLPGPDMDDVPGAEDGEEAKPEFVMSTGFDAGVDHPGAHRPLTPGHGAPVAARPRPAIPAVAADAPDPDDDMPAEAGLLSRICAVDSPFPAETAEAILPLAERLWRWRESLAAR